MAWHFVSEIICESCGAGPWLTLWWPWDVNVAARTSGSGESAQPHSEKTPKFLAQNPVFHFV